MVFICYFYFIDSKVWCIYFSGIHLFSILNNGETFRDFIKGQITEKENILLKIDELKQKQIAKLRWYNLSLRMKEAKVSS